MTRFIAPLLSLVVPGAGHIWAGHFIRAAAWAGWLSVLGLTL